MMILKLSRYIRCADMKVTHRALEKNCILEEVTDSATFDYSSSSETCTARYGVWFRPCIGSGDRSLLCPSGGGVTVAESTRRRDGRGEVDFDDGGVMRRLLKPGANSIVSSCLIP